MLRLTRRYRFSSSHRLHSDRLSDGENDRVYGKCNYPFGHGHDYVLDVSVTGPMDESTGRIVDLDTLDSLVANEVVSKFEHRNLNAELDAFKTAVPTTENIGVEIKRRLDRSWAPVFGPDGPVLDKIRIEETKRNYIELQ